MLISAHFVYLYRQRRGRRDEPAYVSLCNMYILRIGATGYPSSHCAKSTALYKAPPTISLSRISPSMLNDIDFSDIRS